MSTNEDPMSSPVVAGSVTEAEKNRADGPTAVAAEDASVEEWVPGQLIEMPKDRVEWILSEKRRVLQEDPDEYYNRMINDPDRPEIFTPEFLEEERQLMRDLAEQYRISGDSLEKFQEWLRLQLETKGRVLVGETYLAQRIRVRQAFAEEFGPLWHDE
ncbi:hypothetical protein QOZ80_9AG0689090 [Eleusine coracana subsp. coracana]|nr:hypothetical protein QOZ80_9AG0689090 [Eleusine coracana subsp. coracana]